MTEPQIRGYSVQRQLAFLDQHFEESDRERARAAIPDSLREAIPQLGPADWCSMDYAVAVLRAIGGVKKDPDGAYQDLVECGRYVSAEATNTFFKLVLKFISPGGFLKKLPSFWTRDFKNAGVWRADIDEAEKTANLTLEGVEGLDHLAPVSEGFILFVLEAMGHEVVRSEMKGWSLETPGPAEVQYKLSWS